MATISNIFPSVQLNDVKTRSFTEENVANLIYNFIDNSKNGFVITDTNENANPAVYYDGDNDFEFNIRGYYIKLSGDLTNGFSGNAIYASIQIVTPNGTSYSELDSTYGSIVFSGNLKGVDLTDTDVTDVENGIYCLQILKKITVSGTNKWVVPEESKIRFKPSNVGLEIVDGGTW